MIKRYQLYFAFFIILVIFASKCIALENYNVILITVDTLRADHLGSYGYYRNTSPSIDNLAKEEVIFDNVFSQASYTLSSMMSILTSLYPYSHGIFHIAEDRLSSGVKTLAEVLKASGYKTAYFLNTKDMHTDPGLGFGRGFDYGEDIYSWPLFAFCSI